MKIVRSTVTKLVITGAPNLDPITVYAEDLGPRQGSIVIECWGKAWSGYWGGMGNKRVAEFFRSCSVGYLAGKLTDASQTITDSEAIADGARRQIIKLRRGEVMRSFVPGGRTFRIGRNDITPKKARDLWEEVDGANFGNDGWGEANLMQEVFGDEWWYSLPAKPNPDYEYLCRIIEAVQSALKQDVCDEVAA